MKNVYARLTYGPFTATINVEEFTYELAISKPLVVPFEYQPEINAPTEYATSKLKFRLKEPPHGLFADYEFVGES